MSEWKRVKLKELIKEVNERNKGEKVKRVLSVTNSRGFVSQEEYFEGTVHSANISNYKIVRKNQFAYNPSRVNVGSIDILKDYECGALSPMYVVFEVDTTKLLPDYFKYYFQTNRFFENVKNNTQGSVRNSLSFKSLADFDYLLPPIEEQKKIISLLNSVDIIINYIEVKEEKIRQCKKELLQKEYGKNWKEYKFKELIIGEIRNGVFKNPNNVGSGYKLINVMDLYNEPFIDEKKLELLKVTDKEYELNKVNNEDLFFTRSSLKLEGIAHCNIYYGNAHNIIFECHVMRATPNKEKVNSYLLKNLFGIYEIRKQIIKKSKTTTMTTIGQEDLLNIKVRLPKLEEQNKISMILKKFDENIQLMELKNKEYKNIKKAIMQKLLTGKVRVKI